MIVHLVFTLCVLGLTLVNYYVGRKNVLYPAFLISLVWLVVFCLYMVPLIEIDPVGAYTLAFVLAGVVAFSLGAGMIGRSCLRPSSAGRVGNTVVKKVLFFYGVAILPLFYLEVRRLAAEGGSDSFFVSARTAIIDAVMHNESAFGNPLYTTAPVVAIFVAFIFFIEAREWRRERVWVWVSVALALVFSVLTTGRSLLLQLVLGLAGIYLLRSGKTSAREAWRFVRWPLMGFVALFALLVPFTKGVTGSEGGATEAIADYAFGYTVIPLAGLDYVFHHSSDYRHEPNHTFREVIPILARLSGQGHAAAQLENDFVSTPLPTNVYTVFKSYYVDFGLAGTLIVMFLIGAGQTWLFRKALEGKHLYIFLFALFLYPLTMTMFDDQYSLLAKHAKDILFGLVYFEALRVIPLRTRIGVARPSSPW